MTVGRKPAGRAARGQADLLQQDGEGNSEAVVNRGVIDVPDRDAGRFLRPGSRRRRAELRQGCRRADVLMGMRLARADDAHREVVAAVTA